MAVRSSDAGPYKSRPSYDDSGVKPLSENRKSTRTIRARLFGYKLGWQPGQRLKFVVMPIGQEYAVKKIRNNYAGWLRYPRLAKARSTPNRIGETPALRCRRRRSFQPGA